MAMGLACTAHRALLTRESVVGCGAPARGGRGPGRLRPAPGGKKEGFMWSASGPGSGCDAMWLDMVDVRWGALDRCPLRALSRRHVVRCGFELDREHLRRECGPVERG
eukprot:3524280-Prymnesium_polylepis.1